MAVRYKKKVASRKRRKILLVEPAYKNKFPPVGLMKIANAYLLNGDEVTFFKGTNAAVRDQKWDLVYITTLFTYQWRITIETILFFLKGKSPVLIGGVLATLMPEEIEKATGIKPHLGPYKGDISNLRSIISEDKDLKRLSSEIFSYGIDCLPPAYGIFNDMNVPYKDMVDEYYLLRSTKGYNRGCRFCAVKCSSSSGFGLRC